MPSASPKQARLMEIAAKNPKFAKQVGIPQEVAEDFHEADKKKRGSKGLMEYIRSGTKHEGGKK